MYLVLFCVNRYTNIRLHTKTNVLILNPLIHMFHGPCYETDIEYNIRTLYPIVFYYLGLSVPLPILYYAITMFFTCLFNSLSVNTFCGFSNKTSSQRNASVNCFEGS